MKKRRFLKNNKGQGLIEYLVIVALMAIAAMAVMRVMSQTVQARFAQVTRALQGTKGGAQIKMETLKESDFKKRDMSDFFHGTQSGDRE